MSEIEKIILNIKQLDDNIIQNMYELALGNDVDDETGGEVNDAIENEINVENDEINNEISKIGRAHV